ncbi:hypothetical protein LX99_04246 [Mucilaginibacter oryzae]|uniref:Uncharacterized protein n=1 Tax=Mucilaginibacter oryzae TaxID=468058 RepID=A0A316H203_9SPHI|nr:hypothetical protein [Mucilaginibacter oryzae]PWK72916.1 hypothetical protein LX99_04246 [Mucilaginibacter oryzae]
MAKKNGKPKPHYGVSLGRAYSAGRHVVNDSIGKVFYTAKLDPKIFLENNTDTQNGSLLVPKNDIVIDISAWTPNTIDCFYKTISDASVYSETIPNGVKSSKRSVTGPTLNIYKIKLSDTISTLEIRNNDPFSVKGIDVAPFDILESIAITKDEVESITGKVTSNNFQKTNLYIYFNSPESISNPGYRSYFKSELGVLGSVAGSTKSISSSILTGINVYSLDRVNWVSNNYANAAFAKIPGFTWDNQIIPNPVGIDQPFSGNWTNIKNKLSLIISDANSIDNKGARLLTTPHAAIRDYIYQGNLDKLSFEMAFRLPFFIERPMNTPYQNVIIGTDTRANNPYYTKFSAWFGYANSLRSTDKKLSRAGHMQSFTDLISSTPDHLNLYSAFTNDEAGVIVNLVRNPSLTRYHIPAYIAALMNDENTHTNFDAYFTVPSGFKVHLRENDTARTKARTEKSEADILSLKTHGYITEQSYNNLIQSAANVFVAEPIVKTKASASNGYYVFKSATDNKFYIYDKINSNYYQGNSGLTVAFGYDMGGKGKSDYGPITTDTSLQYITGFTVDSPTTGQTQISNFQEAVIKAGFGLHKEQAVALFYTYFENVFSVMKLDYDYAVGHAQPLMNKKYLAVGIGTKSGLRKPSYNYLQVYPETSGGIPFYEAGGIQYFNEIEKYVYGTQLYNVGAGGFNAGFINKKGVHSFLKAAMYFTHAVNTHDIRWMKEFLRKNNPVTTMWRREQLRRLVDHKTAYDHYDFTQTSL